ncbi:hypothetical protein [Kitasatospora terrestris]|uniref:Uncharacterized protein n=1 Tax=Kitasatospora terrestris TaxID=258051 RepID=A0ABP9DAF7_9ACTN
MTYHLDTARATIDERLREASEYRLARAIRLRDRAEATARRARQVLSTLGA